MPLNDKLLAPEELPLDELQTMPRISAAIRSGDAEEVARLFEEHPCQKSVFTPFGGQTWLAFAAWEGQLDIVRLLAGLGMGINTGDRWNGTNALHSAASGGHVDTAADLLDRGAEMDVSASVRNPLFAAIVGRSPDVARLLLERGIDSRVRYSSPTMKDMDAVAFALMRGEAEIARMTALHNAGGDEAAAEAALAEGGRIAELNAR